MADELISYQISMKKFLALITLVIVIGGVSFGTSIDTASAATFRAGDNYVSDTAVSDNFYGAGENLSLNNDFKKDAFIAGNSINLTGKTGDDLFAVGANVNLLESVGGDARVAGGTVILNAPISGEAMIAGGTISFGSKAVAGELYIAGSEVTVDGTVKGNVLITGDKVVINGTINGNARIYAGDLVLGDGAKINGSMEYDSAKQAVISETAKIKGEVKYNVVERKEGKGMAEDLLGGIAIVLVAKALFMIALATVLYLIFKKGVKKGVEMGMAHFGNDLLIGLIVLIVAPVAGVILIMSIVGMPVACFAGLVYVVMIMLGGLMSMYLTAGLIGKIFKVKSGGINVWTVIAGAFVIQVVCIIPVIGWIFAFVMFLAGFGLLLKALYNEMVLKLR